MAEDTGKGEGRKQKALFVDFTVVILYNEPPTKPRLSPRAQWTKCCLKNTGTKQGKQEKRAHFLWDWDPVSPSLANCSEVVETERRVKNALELL